MAMARGKWTLAWKCWLNPTSSGLWQKIVISGRLVKDLIAVGGLDEGGDGPAQLQREDEEVPLLHVLILPVAVVQLHGDAVRLLPAQERLPGALSGPVWNQVVG